MLCSHMFTMVYVMPRKVSEAVVWNTMATVPYSFRILLTLARLLLHCDPPPFSTPPPDFSTLENHTPDMTSGEGTAVVT